MKFEQKQCPNCYDTPGKQFLHGYMPHDSTHAGEPCDDFGFWSVTYSSCGCIRKELPCPRCEGTGQLSIKQESPDDREMKELSSLLENL